MPDPRRIAVVGAGLAGLSAAYELARTPGIVVTLFEASHRLGGTIETVTIPSAADDPFVIETGPDSWVSDKLAARNLAIELGLKDQLIYSNDARRRNYLAAFAPHSKAAGKLTPMPDGMRMMVPTRWAPVLESPLFSWQARLAYLREPKRAEELKHYALTHEEDESVGSFVRRHFGDEATETIAGPLLAGVFGGDIEILSAHAVLAPFVRMEREQGSLIDAVMERVRRQQAQPPRANSSDSGSTTPWPGGTEPIFTTLRSGLSTLIDRMAATLPEGSLRLGCRVTGLAPHTPAGATTGWCLRISDSDHPDSPQKGDPAFDAVILATPAHVTRHLLEPLDPQAAALLRMDATSAIVVALAYEPAAAAPLRIPRGFGFLVPPAQALSAEPSLLAGTFMDQKFVGRAPRGAIFLRGFFGGQAAPRMMHWPDEQIAEAARFQFSRLLGPLPAASHTLVRRWPLSLPQYAVGHIERMRVLEGRIHHMRGLRLIGNAYQGVGLPNLVQHGRTVAGELAQSL